MRRLIKILTTSLILSLFFSITIFAVPSNNSTSNGNTTVSQHRENIFVKGNETAEGGLDWGENGDLNVDLTWVKTGDSYYGDGNYGHFNNPSMTTGQDVNSELLAAGCSQEQINAYMSANSLHQDAQGWWRTEDGRIVNVIYIADILGDDVKKPAPNLKPGVTPTNEGSWILVSSTKTALLSYNGTGSETSLSAKQKNNKIFQGNEIKKSYSYGATVQSGSPKSIYESNPADITGSLQRPDDVRVHITYTGQYATVMKYNYKKWHEPYTTWEDSGDDGIKGTDDDNYKHHDGYWEWRYGQDKYIIIAYPTASGAISYDANIQKPKYTELKPLDLKTEEAYNGTIKINNTHGYTLKNPDSKSNSIINAKITDKSGREKNEMLTLIANNNPVGFTIDFKDTWFGVPKSEHLDGTTKGWTSDGYQHVTWAQLYFGADMDSLSRDPKVSSIAILQGGNAENETLEPTFASISNGVVGETTFFLRNIMENPEGEYYNLGESGNNCWWTLFEAHRHNLKGCDWNWKISGKSANVSAGITNKNYTKYMIFDYFKQPVLYGEYDSKSAAGR